MVLHSMKCKSMASKINVFVNLNRYIRVFFLYFLNYDASFRIRRLDHVLAGVTFIAFYTVTEVTLESVVSPTARLSVWFCYMSNRD